jgi:hypothetical protein
LANKKTLKFQNDLGNKNAVVPEGVKKIRNTVLGKIYNNSPIEVQKKHLPVPKPIAGDTNAIRSRLGLKI